jgi:CDP-diacylglycerol--glycerol-3-phosphate 3-phosphatidyltransferase
MFSDKFNQQIRQWMEGAASPFVRYKISANAITTAGAVLAVLAAIFIYLQIWWLACLIYFLSGVCDMLDGAVARITHKNHVFGSFWDSVMDRIADAVILVGVIFYAIEAVLEPHKTYIIFLCLMTMLGSFMVSYARAKAESLGIKGEVGFFPRPERWLLILVALITHKWLIVLWILTLGSWITFFQRIQFVYRQSSQK